jgi:hypothetical protein
MRARRQHHLDSTTEQVTNEDLVEQIFRDDEAREEERKSRAAKAEKQR